MLGPHGIGNRQFWLDTSGHDRYEQTAARNAFAARSKAMKYRAGGFESHPSALLRAVHAGQSGCRLVRGRWWVRCSPIAHEPPNTSAATVSAALSRRLGITFE